MINNKNEQIKDNIELSMPVNPAYVSAARLTASTIANRIGFDADEIEDVKAAVSEACTFIIKNAPAANEKSFFKIVFLIYDSSMDITLSYEHAFPNFDLQNEMGLMMIKALMDNMSINASGSAPFNIKMTKIHKLNVFE